MLKQTVMIKLVCKENFLRGKSFKISDRRHRSMKDTNTQQVKGVSEQPTR